MSQYHFYQREGGEEAWKVVPASDIAAIGEHMYRTILSVDTPPVVDMSKEEIAKIKFSGPLYFDLDDSESPASTAKHLATLIEKLAKYDVQESVLAIYASGGKGFHMVIAPEVFIDKVSKSGYTNLPYVYKELAYDLAVTSMDFRVYSGRKGRMFRVENVKRPNGKYKVQLTINELREVASLPPEQAQALYDKLCSTPRTTWEVPNQPRAFGLQALFDTSQRKVDGAVKKAAKAKPIDLPDELPSFDALLRGEGIKADAGFHPIAMQVAITAHARGMSMDELIEAADGLVHNHVSDGSRYNTVDKRKHELRRMFDYTEDNPCYAYGAGAIKALLTHSAPDLQGIEVTAEEIQEGIEAGEQDEGSEYDHAGVILTSAGVSIPTNEGAKKALALHFGNVTELVSSTTGNATVLQAEVTIPGGKSLGHKTFELDQFNSASALNKAVMPFGQVFTGSDPNARGLYLRLIEKARKGGRRVYVLNREGVDIVTLPFHEQEEVRKGVVVFADRDNVLVNNEATQYPDFRLKFVGFPDPVGIYKSDLSMAPRMSELDADTVESLRQTIYHLVLSQTAAYMGKLLGWTTACHYRMLFHKCLNQFPLLHVNGAAGAGKTSMVRLVANLHYYRQEPKMLTPTSTSFAIKEACAASASIPLIIDEYKPHEMTQTRHDEFKLMFRDAYNCREISRGGGSRESGDYRSIQTVQLSAPICFIAEATESEPAVMERVILLTLVKGTQVRNEAFFQHYSLASENRHVLGILGAYIARTAVNDYSVDALKKEFDVIYSDTRKELMLQPGEASSLTLAERKVKAGAKERTAYNYAVLRFGLRKFEKIVETIFKKDENEARKEAVMEALADMYADSTSSVEELQQQTIPEWLKVMNSLSVMCASQYTAWYLAEGKEYAVFEQGGMTLLEIGVRTCYTKYRLFCAAKQEKPLFPSEMAYIHALRNLPSCQNVQGGLSSPGGSLVFDLEELRMQGFIDMPMKGRGMK